MPTRNLSITTATTMCYCRREKDNLEGANGGTYNLGQNEWNISTTPPSHFNDAKMAGFGLRATSSLLWGGRGLIVPFYSVQDCGL